MKLRVTIDAQTFEVEVGDLNARPVVATIDGETFEVWPEAAEEKGASTPAAAPQPAAPRPASPRSESVQAPEIGKITAKNRAVTAPIPGVIISVAAKPGDSITFGQELCVLEAMKMKNSIRANRAGTIASVSIAVGDQVRHGQVLLEYTD